MHGCCFRLRTPLQQRGQQWGALESLERSAVFCQRAVQHIENKMSNLPVFCRPLLPWKQVQRLPISSFFFSLHYPYHTPHCRRHRQTPPLHSACCCCRCLPSSPTTCCIVHSHTGARTQTRFAHYFHFTLQSFHNTGQSAMTENRRATRSLDPALTQVQQPSLLHHSEPQEERKEGHLGRAEETKRNYWNQRTVGVKTKLAVLCFIFALCEQKA